MLRMTRTLAFDWSENKSKIAEGYAPEKFIVFFWTYSWGVWESLTANYHWYLTKLCTGVHARRAVAWFPVSGCSSEFRFFLFKLSSVHLMIQKELYNKNLFCQGYLSCFHVDKNSSIVKSCSLLHTSGKYSATQSVNRDSDRAFNDQIISTFTSVLWIAS